MSYRLDDLRARLVEARSIIDDVLALLEPELGILEGTMSIFGGPDDAGVAPDEGLALVEPEEVDEFDEDLFLPEQPAGTSGLARRLNPNYPYIACRWDYEITPRDWLQTHTVSVENPKTKRTVHHVQPVDWGPHQDTGRVADLSPGLAAMLQLQTDDECIVKILIPPLVA